MKYQVTSSAKALFYEIRLLMMFNVLVNLNNFNYKLDSHCTIIYQLMVLVNLQI